VLTPPWSPPSRSGLAIVARRLMVSVLAETVGET
jgi:hypothetical protein